MEGTHYCPMMLPKLISANLDYINGHITEAERDLRIEQRRAFALRPNGKPDAEGHQRFLCLASDGAPADSPLRTQAQVHDLQDRRQDP